MTRHRRPLVIVLAALLAPLGVPGCASPLAWYTDPAAVRAVQDFEASRRDIRGFRCEITDVTAGQVATSTSDPGDQSTPITIQSLEGVVPSGRVAVVLRIGPQNSPNLRTEDLKVGTQLQLDLEGVPVDAQAQRLLVGGRPPFATRAEVIR